MIVFDLCCSHGHVFEACFGSSAAYADQRERALIACPICGNTGIDKAVMAPNIAAKGNRASAPADKRAMLAALAEAQARVIDRSEWVGRQFPDRARAMYLGDEPAALIHGETTAAEARELLKEGVPIAPLLVPVVPPHARN